MPSPGAYQVSISKDGKTLTLDVEGLYVEYDGATTTNMIWQDGGSYTLSDKLAANAYDTARLNWSLISSNGDNTASFNTNTAVLSFGENGGGSYTIRVASKDLASCYDDKTMKIWRVDIKEAETNIAVTNVITLHLTTNSTPDTQWEITPSVQNGASIQGSSSGTSKGVQGDSVMENIGKTWVRKQE